MGEFSFVPGYDERTKRIVIPESRLKTLQWRPG